MKLERLKEFGAARTKDKQWDTGASYGPDPEDDCQFARGPIHFHNGKPDDMNRNSVADMRFANIASNHWDALIEVVEAAVEANEHGYGCPKNYPFDVDECRCGFEKMQKAFIKLERIK